MWYPNRIPGGDYDRISAGALTADEIAEVAEFFSFGTNDLTQMVYGISRDDAGKFSPSYLTEKSGNMILSTGWIRLG